jgi:hypothetical protein
LSLDPLLAPLVAELKDLHPAGPGVPMSTFKHPHPKCVRVKACLISAVCDLPAGKKLGGFVSHNGQKGCSRCERTWSNRYKDKDKDKDNEGKEEKKVETDDDTTGSDLDDVTDEEGTGSDGDDDQKRRSMSMSLGKLHNKTQQRKRRRMDKDKDKDKETVPRNYQPLYKRPYELGIARNLIQHRQDAKAWRDAETMTQQKAIAKNTGVKYSVLLELDYWDPTRFVVIDSLHAFWLGVCRTLMVQWRDMKWSKSADLKVMQSRLNAMEVPADVCRLLNKWGANMSGLTGQQIKAFVSSFSIPVFAGFLDEREEKLWRFFVVASRLLSLNTITVTQVDQVGSCPVLSCPVLSCPVLSCPVLFCHFICDVRCCRV